MVEIDNSKSLEKRVKCLHQLFKPTITNPIEEYKEGYGNCNKCTYDSINNPKCKGYQPIKIYMVEVEE